MSTLQSFQALPLFCELRTLPRTLRSRPHLYMKWERVNGRLMATWLQQPD